MVKIIEKLQQEKIVELFYFFDIIVEIKPNEEIKFKNSSYLN